MPQYSEVKSIRSGYDHFVMKKYLSELKTAYSTNLGMKLRVVF